MTTNKPEVIVVNEDKMREEFEAWAVGDCFTRDRMPCGIYTDSSTEIAWRAWQAARVAPAIQRKPVGWVWYSYNQTNFTSGSHHKEVLEADGVKLTPVYAAPQPAEQQPEVAMLVAWLPYLVDRADGVAGHYAIARKNPAGYREVWNLRSHHWAAFSDEVLTMNEALAILKKLEMPTATQPVEQVERWRHDSEDLEALHHNLDDAGTPRHHSSGAEYSAWGRVIQYAKAAAPHPEAAQGEPVSHDWDDQDKCRRCGDRDWYAGPTCTPKQPAEQQPDVAKLVEALEYLMEKYPASRHLQDTCSAALATYRKEG